MTRRSLTNVGIRSLCPAVVLGPTRQAGITLDSQSVSSGSTSPKATAVSKAAKTRTHAGEIAAVLVLVVRLMVLVLSAVLALVLEVLLLLTKLLALLLTKSIRCRTL